MIWPNECEIQNEWIDVKMDANNTEVVSEIENETNTIASVRVNEISVVGKDFNIQNSGIDSKNCAVYTEVVKQMNAKIVNENCCFAKDLNIENEWIDVNIHAKNSAVVDEN